MDESTWLTSDAPEQVLCSFLMKHWRDGKATVIIQTRSTMKAHARLVLLVALCLTLMGISLRAAEVDDAWRKQVTALPAEKQVEAVAKKFKELNPGFDGKVTPLIEKGVVTYFSFLTDDVTDISPVRALAGLK